VQFSCKQKYVQLSSLAVSKTAKMNSLIQQTNIWTTRHTGDSILKTLSVLGTNRGTQGTI